jgi:copper(I)-binding protein
VLRQWVIEAPTLDRYGASIMAYRFLRFLSFSSFAALFIGAQSLCAIGMSALAQGTPTYRAGSLVIEAPWSRATLGGAKVGSGYMRIVNRGSEPDRLIGGTAVVAGRVEVHESSTVDGIARMRPVGGGLLIRPGESVELKPGGLHAMLVDLTRPLKEGEAIKGTLVFEKGGTVAIEYRVGGIGAQSAGAGHHHH